MAQYVTYAQATSNATANTEDEFVELTGASGVSFFLKRVRISCNTPNSDVAITPRVVSLSAAGSGGTSGTVVKKRPLSPAATSTVKIKNGTTAFTPILTGMQIYHNYVRPHEALNGKTPSEVTGIEVNGENMSLTLIQNASKPKA
jgi:hypothetical protein